MTASELARLIRRLCEALPKGPQTAKLLREARAAEQELLRPPTPAELAGLYGFADKVHRIANQVRAEQVAGSN